MPFVAEGDDISVLILSASHEIGYEFQDGYVVVVAQKIVSKAEGHLLDLNEVVPSSRAYEMEYQ